MKNNDVLSSARDHLRKKLSDFNSKVASDLDFDFSTVIERIESFDEFEEKILNNYFSDRKIFYRGERINSPDRRLLPTMLRNPEEIFKNNDLGIVQIDSAFLVDYYSSLGSFVNVFRNTMGPFDENNLYELCAFAQHYYDFSPLIDFTKSIYPALSFAIKDRDTFDDDIVLFTVEINADDDYTCDIETANKWLRDYSVFVSYFDELAVKNAVKEIISNKKFDMSADFRKNLESISKRPVPTAKLIDVPTNTRMKFQQGVFLLLDDFQLFNNSYLTKQLREEFIITKFVISKDICPQIKKYINDNAPWYSYRYLTDIAGAFKIAKKQSL